MNEVFVSTKEAGRRLGIGSKWISEASITAYVSRQRRKVPA